MKAETEGRKKPRRGHKSIFDVHALQMNEICVVQQVVLEHWGGMGGG